MTLPTIKPAQEIGAYRPVCVQPIRVAEGLPTRSAQYGAQERKRKGIPVDQCGRRSDFLVDGKPICRAHAGQLALQALIAQQERGPVCGCSDEIVQRVTVDGGTCGRGGCPHGGDF